MEVEQPGPVRRILSLSFNQDENLFAVGTDSGFAVFSVQPVSLQFERSTPPTAHYVSPPPAYYIDSPQWWHRPCTTPLPQQHPRFGRRRAQPQAMLWDDKRQKVTGEITFRSEVKAVRIRQKHLVIALENKIFIYELAGLRMLQSLDTLANPRGLLAINTDLAAPSVLGYPSESTGQVGLYDCDSDQKMQVQAYQNGAIGYLSLDSTGTLLAVSSEKGTRIKIFHVRTQQLQQELRRGSEHACINQLGFQQNGPYLSCSSDSGTVHVFIIKSLQENQTKETKQSVTNKSSNFAFMRKIIPYFSSEWSLARLRLNSKQPVVVSFQQRPEQKLKDGLLVLGMDNLSYTAGFDPYKPGDCQEVSRASIF